MTTKSIMRFISFMMSILALLLEDKFYGIRKDGTREVGQRWWVGQGAVDPEVANSMAAAGLGYEKGFGWSWGL